MKDVCNRIFDILKDRFEIDIDRSEHNICEAGIFGSRIGLYSRDLVYLLVILEKEYDMKFDEKYFDDESFYTVRGVAEAVCESTDAMMKAS